MNKASISSCCSSEVITIREGNKFVAECSYCGTTIDKGFVVEDFIPEFDGTDE